MARTWAEHHRHIRLHVIEVELPSEHAHVGSARRLAMDEACRRLFAAGRPRGVIATTDADTIVSRTWLATTLQEVALGAEAVGGRILVIPEELRSLAPAVRARFLRNVGYWALVNEVAARIDPRPGDPWPCHEQFSGASLALTARGYRAVGGLPPLPSSEDMALGMPSGAPTSRSGTARLSASTPPDGWTVARRPAWPTCWPRGQVCPWTARFNWCRARRPSWRERPAAAHCVISGAMPHSAAKSAPPRLPILRNSPVLQKPGCTMRFWTPTALRRPARRVRGARTVAARSRPGRCPPRDSGLRAWLEPYRRTGAGPPGRSRAT